MNIIKAVLLWFAVGLAIIVAAMMVAGVISLIVRVFGVWL